MNVAHPNEASAPRIPEWTPRFDAAAALWIGDRKLQEDALSFHFQDQADIGFVVLSDGMGGHTSGEVASSLVVSEVFSEIEFEFANLLDCQQHIPKLLHELADQANTALRETIEENSDFFGMGATLVSPIFVQDNLFWVSVGDSPFYRVREGHLEQLNADHSMAAEIDLMVQMGMLEPDKGRDHPNRKCLKSAITGEPIKITDCPAAPEKVLPNDIFIIASDGLQSLANDEICGIAWNLRDDPAEAIVDSLLATVKDANNQNQDNVSVAVVKAAGY